MLEVTAHATRQDSSNTQLRTTLLDVGRDRYFLNALRPPSSNGMECAPIAVPPSAANSTTRPPFLPATEPFANRTLPDRDAVPGQRVASTAHAVPRNVSNAARSATLPAANVAAIERCTVQLWTALPAAHAVQHSQTTPMPNVTASADASPMQGHSQQETPVLKNTIGDDAQRITLLPSSNGVDVLLRNYYLDTRRAQDLVAALRQALLAAGKQPGRIYFNGEEVAAARTQRDDPSTTFGKSCPADNAVPAGRGA